MDTLEILQVESRGVISALGAWQEHLRPGSRSTCLPAAAHPQRRAGLLPAACPSPARSQGYRRIRGSGVTEEQILVLCRGEVRVHGGPLTLLQDPVQEQGTVLLCLGPGVRSQLRPRG